MNRQYEINRNNTGERMMIIEYRNCNDIDILTEDGNIYTGRSYQDFKRGAVKLTDEITTPYEPEYKSDNTTINEERERTFLNIRHLLDKYHKCVMIRPCSFGKTVIGTKLFALPEYKRCLFLHPIKDEINAKKIKTIPGKVIDVRTYQWLASRTDKQLANMKYDIVFMDEVHRTGGDIDGTGAYKTFIAAKKMMVWNPEIHFVGATATPYRMDGIDVIENLFLGHTCYPYTDEDAFEDGLLKKPYYLYNTYNIYEHLKQKLGEKSKNILHNMSRDEISSLLNSEVLERVDAKNMDKHIKKACDKYLDDTSYMRFIAFYLTIEDIKDNKTKVINWFKKAYPNKDIHTIEVHSRSDKDLKAIDDLPTTDGRIDIIFNCEKLCMGYHSEHITGLIMDRKTQSMSKYAQMVGRLLSCDNKKPVIIFDIVDNFHTPFVVKRPPEKIPEIKEVTKEEEITYDFDSLRKAHPYATDWEIVNQKPSSTSVKTELKQSEFTELDFLREATKEVKEKSLSFLEMAEVYGKAHKKYESYKQAISKTNSIQSVNVQKDKQDTKKSSPNLTLDNLITEDDKELGYVQNRYTYDYKTGSLWDTNHVNMIANELDPDEIVDMLTEKPRKAITNAALNEFKRVMRENNKTPNFSDVENIDIKSFEFIIFKESAKLFGANIDDMLKEYNKAG